MRYTTLHTIITGLLLKKKYPIHFYIDFLVYAQRGFEEIHFDTLRNVRTTKLQINDNGNAVLPEDFMDICSLGEGVGQFVRPLYNRTSINRLPNIDTIDNVTEIPYPNLYLSVINTPGSFSVIKERGIIQMHQGYYGTSVIMSYISDGSEIDNATQVNPYAKSTIESYVLWEHAEASRSVSSYDKSRARRLFDHNHKILRGRINPLTTREIRAIINRNTNSSQR